MCRTHLGNIIENCSLQPDLRGLVGIAQQLISTVAAADVPELLGSTLQQLSEQCVAAWVDCKLPSVLQDASNLVAREGFEADGTLHTSTENGELPAFVGMMSMARSLSCSISAC